MKTMFGLPFEEPIDPSRDIMRIRKILNDQQQSIDKLLKEVKKLKQEIEDVKNSKG